MRGRPVGVQTRNDATVRTVTGDSPVRGSAESYQTSREHRHAGDAALPEAADQPMRSGLA
jgi:hypothetical protein